MHMKSQIPVSAEPRESTDPVERDAPRERLASRLDRIAERARDIYQRRGGHDGKALDDWLQAEREIDEED